jgi:3-oxoacyl-[acyl-carrier protein] reductase
VSPTRVATGSRLQDKIAVIFGAGGEVGAAVANAFARQGARVFLSGRTVAHVKAVADAIPDGGAVAGVAEDGRIDIVFNAMGPQAAEYGNATSTMDLPVEKFLLPISTIVASNFITARAAAHHLLRQGAGVVVFLSGTPSQGTANTTAIGAAFGALESLTRSLAVDLSPRGVRVVCVRTMGMAETRVMHQTYELGGQAMGAPKEKIEEIVTSRALLGRPPSLVDTAGLITYLASDEANTITGAIINSSCGQVLD